MKRKNGRFVWKNAKEIIMAKEVTLKNMGCLEEVYLPQRKVKDSGNLRQNVLIDQSSQ